MLTAMERDQFNEKRSNRLRDFILDDQLLLDIAAGPAILIGITGKSAADLIIGLRLTTLTAFVFGVGLAWAIAF